MSTIVGRILDEMNGITQEMVDWFERRTKNHIDRVIQNMHLFSEFPDEWSIPLGKENCYAIGTLHDATKYKEPDRSGYIIRTWEHRCKRLGVEHGFTPEQLELATAACESHVRKEAHHPEHWGDLNTMSLITLAEMVSDWTAMSQELQGSNSCRPWADSVIGTRFKFNENRKQRIYKMISYLEGKL